MKFAFNNAGVDCVTVGYKNTAEVDEADRESEISRWRSRRHARFQPKPSHFSAAPRCRIEVSC
jgi:hypothetical protein